MLGKRLINSNSAAAGGSCTTDTLQILGDTSCIAYYKMSDATDESGSYDGTPSNVNFNVAGKFGNAGDFNGSSSYISRNSSFLPTGNASRTFSFWTKLDSHSNDAYFMSYGNGATGEFFSPRVLPVGAQGGYISFMGFSADLSSTVEMTTGEWMHLCYTYDGTTLKIYKNAVEIATGSLSLNTSQTRDFIIGARDFDGSTTKYIDGSIDQIRIFNKALSVNEVITLRDEIYCQPTIVPTDNFNTVLYTGDGGTQSIDTLNFRPDFTWIKAREASSSHVLFDSVRGVSNVISTESTSDQSSLAPNGLTAFNDDGFTVKDIASGGNGVNGSPGNTYSGTNAYYVAWNWKAGGDEVPANGTSLTNRSVSANPDAGFSIMTYTGNTSDGTIYHGLNKRPELWIFKNLSVAKSWFTLTNIIDGTVDYAFLDTTVKFNAAGQGNSTDTLLTVNNDGGSGLLNANANNYVAYAFHSVDGMSRVGNYIGTGGSGNNIVTGFRPAFVMVKSLSNDEPWFILDNKRDPNNPRDNRLMADSSAAEDDGSVHTMDFNSNGFTLNGTVGNGTNGSGVSYIFLAFAEEVFTPITRNATNPFGDGSELALYKFEDNATDAEGNYSSTTLPNVTFATGYIDKAAVFNGSSSEIELPSIINFGTNNYTFSFWFNADVVGAGRVIVGNLSGSGMLINIESNNKLRFYHSGGTAVNIETLNVLSTNTWYHGACVMNHSSKAEMYLNGQLQGSSTGSNLGTGSGADLIVGNYPNEDYWFDGKIDQLRIFNRALDIGEVTALFNE